MKMKIELTDTFAGYANYSWVRREEVDYSEGMTDFQIRRLAKKTMDLTGIRGTWDSFSGSLRFRPYGICQVMHVDFDWG